MRLYSGIVKYCGLFLIFCDFAAVFSYNIYIQIEGRAKIGRKWEPIDINKKNEIPMLILRRTHEAHL